MGAVVVRARLVVRVVPLFVALAKSAGDVAEGGRLGEVQFG